MYGCLGVTEDGQGDRDGHWYRVNNTYRECMDMFMAQIERNAGNISRQIVSYNYSPMVNA